MKDMANRHSLRIRVQAICRNLPDLAIQGIQITMARVDHTISSTLMVAGTVMITTLRAALITVRILSRRMEVALIRCIKCQLVLTLGTLTRECMEVSTIRHTLHPLDPVSTVNTRQHTEVDTNQEWGHRSALLSAVNNRLSWTVTFRERMQAAMTR
jgi:hypothetical protein